MRIEHAMQFLDYELARPDRCSETISNLMSLVRKLEADEKYNELMIELDRLRRLAPSRDVKRQIRNIKIKIHSTMDTIQYLRLR